MIRDMDSGRLLDVLTLMEDPRFIGPVAEIIAGEEDYLYRQLSQPISERESDKIRGELKKLVWFAGLHDAILHELQERRKEGNLGPIEAEKAEDA